MTRLLSALASVWLLQFGGSQRAEVIEALSTALADRYLYEDVGKRLARGEFDSLNEPDAFAAAVTDVLAAIRHEGGRRDESRRGKCSIACVATGWQTSVKARASAGCVWRVTSHGNGTTVANR